MTYLSLIKKLDAFVRKYYRNKAIRGLLIATALLTAGFLIFTLAEYFGRFGILGRTVLFWSFTCVCGRGRCGDGRCSIVKAREVR